ncbi:MAG: lysophospholipid acyltransferase family protein [Planctomycetota bacterium]|jgi:1-acyl-sn-glycerol-3-phosphate acyltransferase
MAGQDNKAAGKALHGGLIHPGLFREAGFFERSAKITVRSLYRILWGCVWRHPFRMPKKGPLLLVSNHPSYLDPLGIYVGAPRRIFWMAWKALFSVPWLGTFIHRAGAFPVDHLAADIHAFRTTTRLLKNGEVVGIFPEGGRSHPSGRIFPFLIEPFRIASRLSVPVMPVTVNQAWRIWPREHALPKLGGHFEIIFHAPIPPGTRPPSGNQGHALALAERAREVILSAYRAPDPVREASRRRATIPAKDHPILLADRAGQPLIDWLKAHPDL